MSAYLLAALALLVAVLFLVLRPFLVPAAAAHVAGGDAPEWDDAAARARSAARVERVVRAPRADVAPTSSGTQDAETAPSPSPDHSPTISPDDVRASVEAAIAARKAALRAAHCPGCQGAVGPDDAFCRTCGTRLHG